MAQAVTHDTLRSTAGISTQVEHCTGNTGTPGDVVLILQRYLARITPSNRQAKGYLC